MACFRALAGLLAGLVCVSSAGNAATISFAYLLVDTDKGVVAAAVTNRNSEKGPLSRQLSISCEEKCGLEPYVEKIDDSPLGLFRLSDINDNLISTWVSGTAYVVRVYSLSSTKVKKVLDEHSRGQPTFYVDSKGRDHIRTFARASERTTKIIQHDWVWTGAGYVDETLK
jgi:hypothetical protein